VVVRLAAIKGFSDMIDQPLAVSTLAVALPLLRNSLHDKSEKVRLASVELLLKVKDIRGIHFYDIVPKEHIFARLAEDAGNKQISLQLSSLLLNSFFPSDVENAALLRYHRCLNFIIANKDAAYAFYRNLKGLISLGSVVKFCSYLWVELSSEKIEMIKAAYLSFADDNLGADVDKENQQHSSGASINSNSMNRSNIMPAAGGIQGVDDFFTSRASVKLLFRIFWACLSSTIDDLSNPHNTQSKAFFLKFVNAGAVEATFDAVSVCPNAVEETAILMRLSNLLQTLGESSLEEQLQESKEEKISAKGKSKGTIAAKTSLQAQLKLQSQSKYQSLTSKYYRWYSSLGRSKSTTLDSIHHEIITNIVAQAMLEYEGKDPAVSSIERFFSNMQLNGSDKITEQGGKRKSSTDETTVSLLSASISASAFVNVSMSLLNKMVSCTDPVRVTSSSKSVARFHPHTSAVNNILCPRFFANFSSFVGNCLSDPSKCLQVAVQDSICKAYIAYLSQIILETTASKSNADLKLIRDVLSWISITLFRDADNSTITPSSKLNADQQRSTSVPKSPSRNRPKGILGLSDPDLLTPTSGSKNNSTSTLLLMTKLLSCSLVFIADALLVLDHELVIEMKLPALYRRLCDRLEVIIDSSWVAIAAADDNLNKSKQLILNKLFVDF
jgi:hypothetical protein